jgi:hypothetical protein
VALLESRMNAIDAARAFIHDGAQARRSERPRSKSNRGIGVPILQFDPIETHTRHWEKLPRQQQKANLFVELVDTPTDNKWG